MNVISLTYMSFTFIIKTYCSTIVIESERVVHWLWTYKYYVLCTICMCSKHIFLFSSCSFVFYFSVSFCYCPFDFPLFEEKMCTKQTNFDNKSEKWQKIKEKNELFRLKCVRRSRRINVKPHEMCFW